MIKKYLLLNYEVVALTPEVNLGNPVLYTGKKCPSLFFP